jgi:hypothetical protein
MATPGASTSTNHDAIEMALHGGAEGLAGKLSRKGPPRTRLAGLMKPALALGLRNHFEVGLGF